MYRYKQTSVEYPLGSGSILWTGATSVFVDVELVAGLRKAVKLQYQHSHLAGIAADLVVYDNRAAFDTYRRLRFGRSEVPSKRH